MVFALQFARQFYIAQWYRDCSVEVEKMQNRTPPKSSKAATVAQKKRRQRDEEDSDEEEDSDDNEDEDVVTNEVEKAKEMQQMAEVRKAFLLTQIGTKIGYFATFK